MPWAAEKPFIYTVVENTCNEAKLYDLDETGKGIVKGKILYVKEDPKDVNPFGGRNPLLTKETESKPIIKDIGDEEEEYSFVNEYSSFKKEPIMFVEDESCPVYDTDNEEEESIPVYDTDIKDFIEEEE
ncbi:hypothetical protein Tco_1274967 [Tanacetum coccineum]